MRAAGQQRELSNACTMHGPVCTHTFICTCMHTLHAYTPAFTHPHACAHMYMAVCQHENTPCAHTIMHTPLHTHHMYTFGMYTCLYRSLIYIAPCIYTLHAGTFTPHKYNIQIPDTLTCTHICVPTYAHTCTPQIICILPRTTFAQLQYSPLTQGCHLAQEGMWMGWGVFTD